MDKKIKRKIRKQWKMLDDIPCSENIDDDLIIDKDFLHFKKGTCVYDIWHWFENTYNISITILVNEGVIKECFI